MKIRNIVFDMDGTILNTIDDMHDSVNYMLRTYGYNTLTLDEVKSYVGKGIRVLVEKCLPKDIDEAKLEECFNTFSNYYDRNKNNKTAPYDGILDAMKEIRENGIKMSVVSNKYDKGVKQLAADLFCGFLPIAIGESEAVKPKPNPDGVLLAMDLMGASRDNTVYIGDSEVDYETAINSGLQFIGVSWGFRTEELLRSLGAEHIVHHPSQILAELGKLK